MSWYSLRDPLFAIALGSLLVATATAQTPSDYGMTPERSMTSKLSSSVKSGFSKMSHALIPKASTKEAPDPISLSVPATPSADFHVAVARMAEQTGDLAKAEHHYREALRLNPKHLDALMNYAHMLDRQYKLAKAAELYRLAVQVQPSGPTAHNDLGICYARQGMLDEAVVSIEKAVQLKPKQALYRNNIATILVQSKRLDEAFVHLSAVHPQAVAYYNLGYLLHGAGDKKGAARLFQEALSLDSSLTQAQVWLQKLRPAMAAAEPVTQSPTAEPARQPQTVARRSGPAAADPPVGTRAPMPAIVLPRTATRIPMSATVPPTTTHAPIPSAGSLAPLPQIQPVPHTAVPGQTPPQNLAPLPSIKPLPPVYGGR